MQREHVIMTEKIRKTLRYTDYDSSTEYIVKAKEKHYINKGSLQLGRNQDWLLPEGHKFFKFKDNGNGVKIKGEGLNLKLDYDVLAELWVLLDYIMKKESAYIEDE